jgi:hypothetical protein
MMKYLINGQEAPKAEYDAYQQLSEKYWSSANKQPYAGSQPITEFEADQIYSGLQQSDAKAIREATERMQHEIAVNRRNRIAEGFAFALVAGCSTHNGADLNEHLIKGAITLADALIAELDK